MTSALQDAVFVGSTSANEPIGIQKSTEVSFINFGGSTNGAAVSSSGSSWDQIVLARQNLLDANVEPSRLSAVWSPRVERQFWSLKATDNQPLLRPAILDDIRFHATPDMPTTGMGDWLLEVLRPIEDVPIIVAHELFHTQQTYAGDGRLLARALREGIPDFLAELITGRHINEHVHAWAEPRAHELWMDFHLEMHEQGNRGWLYAARAEGEPNDLGYWVGYRIARAYYERAEDKTRALHDMLTIQDFDAFLAASGIAEDLGH